MFDRKVHMKKYLKLYREKNKNRLKRLAKLYLLRNRNKIKLYKKGYYKKNREEILRKAKLYVQSLRSKTVRREYCKRNRKKINGYARAWRKTPRGKFMTRINDCIRKSRIRNIGGKITLIVVQQVYEENIKKHGTLTCELCFNPIEFGQDSLEHFHPISRASSYNGNVNERKNLGVAHKSCNDKKLAKTLKEWFAKLGVS